MLTLKEYENCMHSKNLETISVGSNIKHKCSNSYCDLFLFFIYIFTSIFLVHFITTENSTLAESCLEPCSILNSLRE